MMDVFRYTESGESDMSRIRYCGVVLCGDWLVEKTWCRDGLEKPRASEQMSRCY